MNDKFAKAKLRLRVVFSEGDCEALVGRLKSRLLRYGYLFGPTCKICPLDYFCTHMSKAVMLYQRFYHLPVTGTITVQTLKHMNRKRCGCADIPAEQTKALNDLTNAGIAEQDPFTFAINSKPWPTYDLTYHIHNGTSDIDNEVDVIDRAFAVWAAVSPLRFTRIEERDRAHIKLGFETGNHGDGEDNAFDGKGGVLAHGFFPENGNVHFDDAETWVDPANPSFWADIGHSLSGLLGDSPPFFGLVFGFDLLEVATHEIGHALGLGHARDRSSIMFPTIANNKFPNYLGEQDVAGILSLYPFLIGGADKAITVNLFSFPSGSDSVTVDLGSPRRALAWGQITFLDSTAQFDRDNAVALDIFSVDDTMSPPAGFGGDHLGSEGAPSNLFGGARIITARKIQFRLRAMHSNDLNACGVGNILLLD